MTLLLLDHVCFPEFTFLETTFQTFLCLFAIRKVGQRKTLSGKRKTLFGQWKTLSSQRKHFPVNGKHFPVKEKFGPCLFPKFTFQETTFQIFLCLFVIRKVGQRKTLSGQQKILSRQQKHFPVNGKHFPVNRKYFPVNGNTFRSTKNTFQSKKNLVWFPGKCFPFWLCLFFEKWFPGNHFPNFPVFICY